MLLFELPGQTPVIPHDVFQGQSTLASLPDGDYEVRGRCRDVAGNYTILSSVQTPIGGEQVLPMDFEIRPGSGLHYPMPASAVLLRAGVAGPDLARAVIAGALASKNISASLTTRLQV